ncbi:Ribbon-helix-helix protein, copG family [Thiovulum sp. ES]|nr:Ribbon-helix-helix protein, copG family [Thiovulum sp. ES]
MVATVRLDNQLSETLDNLVSKMNKQKSEIIREAIRFYAQNIENSKKSRLQNAIQKTLQADLKENQKMENSLNDGI